MTRNVQRDAVVAAIAAASCVCDAGEAPASTDKATTSVEVATATEPSSSTAATDGPGPSTGTDSDASDATGWVYEMPEGCDDGVVDPGVACYKAVPLLGEPISFAAALDVDGDGREDIITSQNSNDSTVPGVRVFAEENGSFTLVQDRPNESLSGERYTEFDLDGDGRRDLLTTENGENLGGLRWWSTSQEELGDQQQSSLGPAVIPTGHLMRGPLPMDVRGDGWPEFLVVPRDEAVPGSSYRVELVSREDEEWTSLGDVAQLSHACGLLEVGLRVDLDGDGDEDLLAYDSGMGCDPYPSEYDPAWYRYHVFLNDRDTGTAQLLGDFPLGAKPQYAMWARDFDQDSRRDVLVDIWADGFPAALVLYGRGDGTLEPGELLDAAVDPPWQVRSVGNIFADHDGAALLSAYRGLDVALVAVANLTSSGGETTPPVAIAPSQKIFTSGDFNGDDLVDFVMTDPTDLKATQVLLSSQ